MGCAHAAGDTPPPPSPPRRGASSVRQQLGNIHDFSCLRVRDGDGAEASQSALIGAGAPSPQQQRQQQQQQRNPLRRPIAALGLAPRTFDPASERDMDALRAERGPRVMCAVQELLDFKAQIREAAAVANQPTSFGRQESFSKAFVTPSMLGAMPTLQVTGPGDESRRASGTLPTEDAEPPGVHVSPPGGLRYNPDAMLDASDLPPVVGASYDDDDDDAAAPFDDEDMRRPTAAFTDLPCTTPLQVPHNY